MHAVEKLTREISLTIKPTLAEKAPIKIKETAQQNTKVKTGEFIHKSVYSLVRNKLFLVFRWFLKENVKNERKIISLRLLTQSCDTFKIPTVCSLFSWSS